MSPETSRRLNALEMRVDQISELKRHIAELESQLALATAENSRQDEAITSLRVEIARFGQLVTGTE